MRDDAPTSDAPDTLFAVDEGRGDTVVLLHSSGMSSRQWRRLIERLAPTRRVIAPDLYGSGQSPAWPAGVPFRLDDDLAAVARVIDARAPGERVHLVGHSYGGMLALTLARRDPSRVRSLAVYDPVAWGALRGLRDPALDADRAVTDALCDDAIGGTEPWFERFVDYWNGEGAWRALSAVARESFLRGRRKVYGEVTSLIRDETPAEAYAVIDAPALVLSGERTPAAARRVGARVAAALPRGAHRDVIGAGHMGPITHAAEVNELVARHLDAAP